MLLGCEEERVCWERLIDCFVVGWLERELEWILKGILGKSVWLWNGIYFVGWVVVIFFEFGGVGEWGEEDRREREKRVKKVDFVGCECDVV